AAGRSDLQYPAVHDLAGIDVDADVGGIADADVGQLGFAEVGLHPDGSVDKRQHLGAGRHQLPRTHLPLADGAVGGAHDVPVAPASAACLAWRSATSCISCDSSTASVRRSASAASSLLRSAVRACDRSADRLFAWAVYRSSSATADSTFCFVVEFDSSSAS